MGWVEQDGPEHQNERHAWATRWWNVLDYLDQNRDRLSPKERAFVANMRVNLTRYRKPTPRQAQWLCGIFGRLGGRWAD